MTKQDILELALDKYKTKAAIAKAIGVSRFHISNIFNGNDTISRNIASAIANLLTEDSMTMTKGLERDMYFYILMH